MFLSIILVFNVDSHILSIFGDYKTSSVFVKLLPPQATSSDNLLPSASLRLVFSSLLRDPSLLQLVAA